MNKPNLSERYVKRPIVVDAVQLAVWNMSWVEEWCGGSIRGIELPPDQRAVDIQTLEGEMRAGIGDYIIKGVKGEFYPCKEDIFAATYEAVPENRSSRVLERIL